MYYIFWFFFLLLCALNTWGIACLTLQPADQMQMLQNVGSSFLFHADECEEMILGPFFVYEWVNIEYNVSSRSFMMAVSPYGLSKNHMHKRKRNENGEIGSKVRFSVRNCVCFSCFFFILLRIVKLNWLIREIPARFSFLLTLRNGNFVRWSILPKTID